MNMPTGTKIAVGALVVIVGGTIIYTWTSTPAKKTAAPVTPTPLVSTLPGGLPGATPGAAVLPGTNPTGPATLTLSPTTPGTSPNTMVPTPVPGSPLGVPQARPYVDGRLAGTDTGSGKGDYPGMNAGNGSTLNPAGSTGFRNGFPVNPNSNPSAVTPNSPIALTPNTTGPRPIGTVNPTPSNSTTTTANAPSSGESNYTVASGDTLGGIAQRFLGSESKWTVIAKANPSIDPNRMRVGTKLRIPSKDFAASAATTVTPSATSNNNTNTSASTGTGTGNYVVRAGDTLSKIARTTYGNSKHWQKIYTANKNAIGNDPANLKVGMKLTIPAQDAIAGVRTDS